MAPFPPAPSGSERVGLDSVEVLEDRPGQHRLVGFGGAVGRAITSDGACDI